MSRDILDSLNSAYYSRPVTRGRALEPSSPIPYQQSPPPYMIQAAIAEAGALSTPIKILLATVCGLFMAAVPVILDMEVTKDADTGDHKYWLLLTIMFVFGGSVFAFL